MKTLKNVLDTYKLVITPLGDEDGPGFIARYEELGFSVRGIGATPAEAMAELEDLALDGFGDLPISELPISASDAPWAVCSGRVTLRLPKMLHAKVIRQAEDQNVSLNQWICHILESASTATAAGLEFGARQGIRASLEDELVALREAIDGWSLTQQAAVHGDPLQRMARSSKTSMVYEHLELHCA
jgi:hypothetical protein